MDSPPLPPDFDGRPDAEPDPDAERIWALLRRVDDKRERAYDVDAEWDRLADRLDLDAADDAEATAPAADAPARRADDRDARAPASAAPARLQGWVRGLAAAVVLVALVGGGLWWGRTASVETAPGEHTVVTLPDGSTVELNGASTLSYPRGFWSLPGVGADARTVRLDGEAFFSVVDRTRPFRVWTANARVEVLGTEFNVRTRAAAGPPTTDVTLMSGRVRLAGGAARAEAGGVVLAEEGQASRVVGTGAPTAPQAVDLKYVRAWRQGGFAMRRASVPAILQELERRYGAALRLRVPAAETDTMTLHYARDARLTDVLRDIALIQNLSYRETSQGYELVRSDS